MKRPAVIICLLTLLVFSSCHREDDAIWRSLNNSFMAANSNTFQQTQSLYRALEDRLYDPQMVEKAKGWQPKVMQLRKFSGQLYDYIEELKKKLEERADTRTDGTLSFNRGGDDIVKSLFITQGKGRELYEKLQQYGNAMLNVDSALRYTFTPTIPVGEFLINRPGAHDFTGIYFSGPAYEALTVLSNFQNRVRLTENQMVQFCFYQTEVMDCSYSERPFPVIAQSSSYVQAGETIELYAGVGSFSIACKPTFTINNKTVSIGADGVAVSKIKASSVPGPHTIRVSVEYLRPDGSRSTVERDIRYEVAKKIKEMATDSL